MADLMQKTKKELIMMLQDNDNSTAKQPLQNELNRLRSDYKSVLAQVEQLRTANKAISAKNNASASEKDRAVLAHRQLQDELDKAISENHEIRSQAAQLRDTCEKLTLRYDALKNEHAALEQRLQESERKSDIAYELFKSFVENDNHRTLLIDTAYAVCYINRAAAAHLRLPDPEAMIGRRLFDFFAYKEAVKVKKKIDAAFFSGEKEKVKDVVFRNPGGTQIETDLKFTRVRYRDKPSIKMIIK